MLDQLGLDAGEATALAVLSDAIAVRAYPDATPALRMVGELGLATAVVSNGDCSLPGALQSCGSRSAWLSTPPRAARRSPTRRSSRWRCGGLGVDAAAALHVGDVPELTARARARPGSTW